MRPIVRFALTASLLVLAFGTIQPGHAQVDSREGIALQNQIYQLRQELKAVEDQSSRGGSRAPAYAPPPSASPQYGGSDIVAQLLTRVDSLEEQVRQLRGQIDQTQNQVQRQNTDINKRIDDLAFQVNPQGAAPSNAPSSATDFSSGSSASPGMLLPPVPTTTQNPSSPQPRASGPRTPEVALQDGNAALARHDYQSAETAAREVLMNRTSPRAYDAQLLLAQALTGQHQYAQAAIAYDDAYNRSRKGTHAQDALVGLANSLTSINEKKAACDTLTRLKTEFSQPRPDIRDSEAAIGQRANCRSPS